MSNATPNNCGDIKDFMVFLTSDFAILRGCHAQPRPAATDVPAAGRCSMYIPGSVVRDCVSRSHLNAQGFSLDVNAEP